MTILFLLIGLGAGILSGIFGIGGGIVIVPALIFLARLSPQQATGTSLGALVLPVTGVAAYTYYRNGNLQLMPAFLIAIGLASGAFLGALLAQHIDALILKRMFAVLLVAVAAKMWFS